MPSDYPDPILSDEFLDAIKKSNLDYSIAGIDRLVRAHGHTLREIFILRHGKFPRIPDIVVWPSKKCSNKKPICTKKIFLQN